MFLPEVIGEIRQFGPFTNHKSASHQCKTRTTANVKPYYNKQQTYPREGKQKVVWCFSYICMQKKPTVWDKLRASYITHGQSSLWAFKSRRIGGQILADGRKVKCPQMEGGPLKLVNFLLWKDRLPQQCIFKELRHGSCLEQL